MEVVNEIPGYKLSTPKAAQKKGVGLLGSYAGVEAKIGAIGAVSDASSFLRPGDDLGEIYIVVDPGSITEMGNISYASAFQDDLNLLYNLKLKKGYYDFLLSRSEYLENLKKIGDDWISGGSKQPSNQSIDKAKALLKTTIDILIAHQLPMPKILLSPIPSGGISIEFHFKSDYSILLTVYDSGRVSFEFELDGYYGELEEIDNSMISGYFSDYIKEYANYPGWRSFV